ncbi:MFS transporter [Aeoliella sp.]|uniref:MFS transporter n=1 Tax=Aeoliella sp. TaxID=2795800 RepID=UPI003CCBB399
MSTSARKLSLLEKVGYGLGDCGANFVFQTQLIFLMSFYTDVFGISASVVGWMFLVSRLWDAVNDPMIGALADRTNTRWGKFRPWVLFTAIPFAFCFVLVYTTPDLGDKGKIVWAYVTYNLLMMVYTANNIPYSALTGVISSDSVERTNLTAWRFLLAMTASFVVQTFTPDLVDYFGQGNSALGYQLTITLWAVVATVFFVITFATTKERVHPPASQKSSVGRDLRDLLNNASWIALAVMTLFYFVYLSMRGSIGKYYFDYYVDQQSIELFGGSISSFGVFNGAGQLASMAGILLSKPLSMRFGKRDLFRSVLLICAAITAVFYWLPPSNVTTIIGLQCLLQFIFGVTIPLTWSMMADVADLSEWINYRRATAMTFAATVFALKLGLSLGGALAGWMLDAFGYVPNSTQSEQAIHGIRLMMSFFPAVAFLLAAAALLFYKIDRHTESTLCDQLEERRRAEDPSGQPNTQTESTS